MKSRREFLRTSTAASLSFLVGCRNGSVDDLDAILQIQGENPVESASDEDFWRQVRGSFDLHAGLTNLNHGLSPSPREVQTAFKSESDLVNQAPLLEMRDWPSEGRREEARRVAAESLGCDPEELAITRSATEALQIAQLGIPLAPGDEVLSTREDYWAMWNTWQQRVEREGIVYREIDLGAPYPPAEEIVHRFEQAITPRTRVILFCHLAWVTGHILPVREICTMARSRGIQTIVDGAHGFGQLPFRVDDLGCDYYGTSGHKWLQAPLGTGLLYVRRERIEDLWPLTPAWEEGYGDDIRKFEFVGSRSPAHHNAIAVAVRFLERLGVEHKAERLHFLKTRWAERLDRSERVHLVTDLAAGRSCGIASFYIEGIDSYALADHLLDRHEILVATPEDGYSGPSPIRVTPNVFTSVQEVDAFADVIEEILRTGLPAGP